MGALRGRWPIALARWIETRAYSGAALITTVTPALVGRLERNPAATSKVRLLENGVDVDRFDPDRDPAAARDVLGWEQASLTLAYVGTVGLAQGVGTVVEAVAGLEEYGVVLHIIGDGADRQELEADAKQKGLRNVRFHSAVSAEHVPAVLAAADAVVVMLKRGPLYDESLPTKLVEGLAAGRPILVSASGWPAAIVSEGGAGLTSQPEDAVALRESILRCLHAGNRGAMGRNGRALAVARFDRRAIVRKLDEYLSFARGPGSSGG